MIMFRDCDRVHVVGLDSLASASAAANAETTKRIFYKNYCKTVSIKGKN